MGLLHYIIRRLLMMVLILIGVTIIVFTIMMLLPPGQRAAVYISSEKIRPGQIDSIIEQFGLDDPPVIQYFRWMGNIVRGNFGFSITSGVPVVDGFKQFFPVTLELVLLATPLIIIVGIWLGTLSSTHKDTIIDHGSRVFAIIGYSLPTFWLGLMLLMIFYGFFGLFPPGVLSIEGRNVIYGDNWNRITGMITIDAILNWRWDVFLDGLYHLLLPAINLVFLSSALILRLTRSSMLEALGQDYIRTALAKGASRKVIYRRHARRNALIPVITVAGLLAAGLMSGMVITETIFNRPGIGLWMASAALRLDIAAIMFNVLFLSAVYVVINLIVDIIYGYVDPRIRLS